MTGPQTTSYNHTDEFVDSVPAGDLEPTTMPETNLPQDRFGNRELSWLAYSERVLAQAQDVDQPL
ncbi:MAG: hypothetical protein ABI368_00605, partial [Jatrophihabitantaceae bacterium]